MDPRVIRVLKPLHHSEDSFELHSVDLELEAMEKQICDLQVKQTQLRQRKAALELSRTDAHLSQVNSRRETITPTTSTPCASLPRPSARTRPAQVPFTPAPAYHTAWMKQQRKTRAKPQARTSPPPPPPVFEIPTQNCFAPLRETACDAVIIGDSIIRHVRATAAKGKVHTRCLPGACVLDVSAQVPAILKKNIGAVVLHAGTNDIGLRQTEILKKDFRSLVELVRITSPTTRIIVSGPLPTFQRGIERCSKPVLKQIKTWPAGAISAIQDCFECTDWDMFRKAATNGDTTDLEECTSSVTSYISKCINDMTISKSITTHSVDDRKSPFRAGDKDALRTTRAKLSQAIRRQSMHTPRESTAISRAAVTLGVCGKASSPSTTTGQLH
ncbi:hypothetical protein QTP70_001746, partial [Hemibagrus guttatus]